MYVCMDSFLSRTMYMTIDQQVALDEAIVPHVVYDVLRVTPFYKAFLVTADVPKIYMQELWATATVHHHSVRFKMNNKKRIVNLEYFREMLHISVINKCLSGKSTGYDSLWLSQDQILWGMYHKMNVDFTYLLWEDFVYQVKYKDAKKSNEMYYPRFTKVIINFFMTKDPSILRRNKFGAMLPIELTNEDIRNSVAYKEYYAIASGAAPPKTKASMRNTQSSSNTTMPPPTAACTRLSTSAKGKRHAKSSKTKRTRIIPKVPDVPTNESDKEISWKSSDEDDDDDVDDQSDVDDDDDDQEDEYEQDDDDQDDNDDDQDSNKDGDDFVHPKLSTHDKEAKDEESFDLIVQTPSQMENSDDERNDDESHGMNVGGDEGPDAEDDDEELYRHGQQQSSSVSSRFVTSMFNPSPDASIDSLFESTPQVDVPVMTIVVPLLLSASTFTPPSIPIMLRDETQTKNEDFINKLDENIQKIIKEQVKILIEKMESNKSIHQSDEQMNLYKYLVDAYECDKIILDTYGDTFTLKRRRDDADKDEEPSAGSDRGSKRRREGKEPESTSAPKEKASKTTGKSTEGSKSHQKTACESAPAEEPMQTTQDLEEPSHQEFESGVADDQPIVEASRHPEWFQKQTKPPTPDRAWNKTLPATHGSIQPWISDLDMQVDSRASFNEMDTPIDFSTFLMNRLNVDTLTPKLLASPTYELMKGSCKSLVELKFFLEEVYKATTDQLDWNNPEGQQYPHNLLKPLPLIPNSR
nr:hypothetical protein [Tanacetum cinerariifolium]GEZ84514.1 hypothetical protein [Tanacetum cinerariifolium]